MNYEGLTDRELWQLLFQKTENEMAAYMNSLNQLSRSELIMAADEISAMRKMEEFCQQQTGMSLRDYAQQFREEQMQAPEMQM